MHVLQPLPRRGAQVPARLLRREPLRLLRRHGARDHVGVRSGAVPSARASRGERRARGERRRCPRRPGPDPRPRRRAAVTRRTKILIGVAIAVIVLGGIGVVWARSYLHRDRAVAHYDAILEHFKYGSLGTEARLGVPAPLFDLFPVMFADLLPKHRPGTGYEKLGFLYEPGHK